MRYIIPYHPYQNIIFPGVIITIVGILFLVLITTLILLTTSAKKYDSQIMSSSVFVKYNNKKQCYFNYIYEVNNIDYTCKSSYSKKPCPEMQNSIIYYYSSNPKKCKPEKDIKLSKLLLLMDLIPIIFLVIGIFQIINAVKYNKKRLNLSNNGTLYRNIPCSTREKSTKKSRRNGLFYVLCVDFVFPDGSSRHFESDQRFPDPYINNCDLLVDMNDYNNYYVNIGIVDIMNQGIVGNNGYQVGVVNIAGGSGDLGGHGSPFSSNEIVYNGGQGDKVGQDAGTNIVNVN